MAEMTVYGVAYRLQYPAPHAAIPARAFDITFCFAYSTADGSGYVRVPRTWTFAHDQTDGFAVERFGASETRGLFGGIGNTRQKALSEACERAIGEVLTLAVCEIMDGGGASEKIVTILGPALPKSVGRLASLRLPQNVRVAWICPGRFPTWITETANEALIMPKYPTIVPFGEGWEDEPLIIGYQLATGCIVQEMQVWDGVPPLEQEKLAWTLCKSGEGAPDWFTVVLLPREILAAAGQAQNHFQKPYQVGKGVEMNQVWRDLPPGCVLNEYKLEPATMLPPPGARAQDGWSVRFVRRSQE
jgi:hypothetical protein